MPTVSSQLPSNGIGACNSSPEESRKLSSSLQPTNEFSLQENGADHATIEQERIYRTNGVRERLSPLIERLKDSVTSIQTLEKSMRRSADGSWSESGGDCESRTLMNKSMEMVKKKMFRLKIMEEELAVSEDRRVDLHHCVRQQAKAVQATITEELSITPTDNCEYQNRIIKMEEEICLLKEKSLLVDDLQVQNARLLQKVNDIERLENDLDLEQSTMDTITLRRRYISNSRSPPGKIEDLETNESLTLTEPMTSLSWTDSSISNYSSTVDENDDSNTAEQSPVLEEETTDLQCTVQILSAKIESLNRENAELRESKSRVLNKYKSLHEETILKSSIIEDLRRKLDCGILE